jgi:hypothetical protein
MNLPNRSTQVSISAKERLLVILCWLFEDFGRAFLGADLTRED